MLPARLAWVLVLASLPMQSFDMVPRRKQATARALSSVAAPAKVRSACTAASKRKAVSRLPVLVRPGASGDSVDRGRQRQRRAHPGV